MFVAHNYNNVYSPSKKIQYLNDMCMNKLEILLTKSMK